MALTLPRRRIKVGTLIGTENRNDDESILRTPMMQFGTIGAPASLPTETTAPAPRAEPPSLPGGADPRDGNGSGDDGRDGLNSNSQADQTPSATPAASTLGVPNADDDLFSDPQISDMASRAAARSQQTQGVPGLPDPVVDDKTPSENNATATKGSVEDPNADTSNTGNQSHSTNAEDQSAAGVAGSAANAPDGGPTGGGDNGDPGGKGGGTSDGTDGTGTGTGTAGGEFRKGVIDIQGRDPSRRGEPIPNVTLHEGETVLTDEETKLMGDAMLRQIKALADDKNLTMAERRTRVRTLIAERN